MEDRVRPGIAARIFGPLIFVVGTPVALYVFLFQGFQLIAHWRDQALLFDKGAFYLLGVGLGMLSLAIATIQEGWFDRTLSQKKSTLLTRLALVGIALIPIAPNAAHFVINQMLTSDGYVVCEKASHQWRFVRDIVYIKPSVECSSSLRDELLGRS